MNITLNTVFSYMITKLNDSEFGFHNNGFSFYDSEEYDSEIGRTIYDSKLRAKKIYTIKEDDKFFVIRVNKKVISKVKKDLYTDILSDISRAMKADGVVLEMK